MALTLICVIVGESVCLYSRAQCVIRIEGEIEREKKEGDSSIY